MSTHSHPESEKRALNGGSHPKKQSEHAKEFKHLKTGVWDIYEQVPPKSFGINIPGISQFTRGLETLKDLRFFWRVLKDVARIKSCWYYLGPFILVKVLLSLQPAVALWFATYYLTVIQVAIDERRLDESLLIFASIGQICCVVVEAILETLGGKLEGPLDLLTKEHFDKKVFNVTAHLDVPTEDDKVVKRRLENVMSFPGMHESIVWGSLSVIMDLLSSATRLVTQLGLLAKVLSDQQDAISFAAMHLGQELLLVLLRPNWFVSHERAWGAFTDDTHYLKLHGLEQLVQHSVYRQEIVAGNLAGTLKTAYDRAYDNVSGKCASYWSLLRRSQTSELQDVVYAFLPRSVEQAVEVAYLVKCAARPETIPACLATIKLIQTTNGAFMSELRSILYHAGSIGDQFYKMRQMYEIEEIKNKIPDGAVSFPEDSRSLASGITVEFRNVSFRYPGKDDFALRNVSFKIGKGQLCVIVGTNGSGKSTVLKLMLRLYDPTEGAIFVNDQDIKTLKLADLRESIAILFQDYTHFPLTIKDNIGLGDPRNAHDENKIREAARLGGAEEFINKMNEGFDTYLERPIRDSWFVPGDSKTSTGADLDLDFFREAIGRVGNEDEVRLSGGQMQRLAVSRMFMRAVLSEEARVGLLLFDEPSAALDPTAEHDLFTRIRKLRGEKTMIFSSHRFGQLTKPADLILYMDDSKVLECGTHNELMAKGGKYAELWNLQAQAFL